MRSLISPTRLAATSIWSCTASWSRVSDALESRRRQQGGAGSRARTPRRRSTDHWATPRLAASITTLTLDVLATFRRLAIATHTLRLAPTAALDVVPSALRELVDALDSELGAIAARLRFGRVTVVRVPLRAMHSDVAAALAGAGPLAVLPVLVIAETDEMVDATNSLAEILDRAPSLTT